MDDEVTVTMVFTLPKSKFRERNPLNTDTPWGIPHTVGIGDAFERNDELTAKLEAAGLA